MKDKFGSFLKEATFAVFSQGLSMTLGFLLSIILPKYLSVENYGYWQLFILYTGYVGLLHFGFVDGLYLRIGGQKFGDLDKIKIYPAMSLMIVLQLIISLIVIGYSLLFEDNQIKKILFIFLGIYIFVDNTYKLMSFILMATGKINFYSRTVVLDKLLMSSFVLFVLLLFSNLRAEYIIAIFVLCHIVVLFLTCKEFKGFNLSCIRNIKHIIPFYLRCVKIGAILMFSNLCGSFIVGSGRFFVEAFWDITVFAKISLTLALSSFLMAFISQISYVIFPYLRNASKTMQSQVLYQGSFFLTFISIVLFLLFFPMYYFIKYYLPQYQESLQFLLFIAPISFYEIRTNVLYNTFFRNLNKVNELFLINIISLLLGCGMYLVAVWLHDIMIMIFGMLVAVVLKCLIMQVYLYRIYKLNVDNVIFVEGVITFSLISSYFVLGISYLFASYFLCVILFSVIYFKRIKSLKSSFNAKL